MQRKFLSNLSLVLFLNFLVKPFWIFGIDRTVQNTLGSEEYGTYFALLNLTFLLNIFLDFGITNYNNRTIAQSNALLRKYFSGIASFRVILGIVYFFVLGFIAVTLKYSSEQLLLLSFLGVNQFLLAFILFLRSNISGLHLFKTDSFISVLDRVIMIVLCGLLLWTQIFSIKFSVFWFAGIQTLAYCITLFVALLLLYSYSGKFKFHWKPVLYSAIIKKSLPFATLIILMTVNYRTDGVMLERMLSDNGKEAGIYAQSFRLLDAANIIGYLFAGLLLPMFSKMLKDKQDTTLLTSLSFRLLFSFAVIVAAISCLFSENIIQLLYRENIEQSSAVFSVLMWSFIPVASSYVFGTLLTANGNLKYLNYTVAFSMVVNIALNAFLIPNYGALGSAFASLMAQFLITCMQVYLIKQIIGFGFSRKELLSIFIFLIILVFTAITIDKTVEFWYIGVLIFGIIGVLAVFLSRMITVHETFNAFRKT